MSLDEILYSYTKEHLQAMADFFRVSLPKGSKKTEMVAKLTAFLRDEPETWLKMLSERDIILLKTLIDAGPYIDVNMDYPEYLSFVEVLKIVESDQSDENTLTLWISKVFYDIIQPVLPKVIKDNIEDGSFLFERMLLGVLGTYGVLTLHEFVDIVFDMDALGMDSSEMGQRAANNPVIRMSQFFENGEAYVVSPYVSDLNEILTLRKKFTRKSRKMAKYSLDEYIDAGCNSPYCFWGNHTEEYRAVEAMLTSFGYDKKQILQTMHEIWEAAQFTDREEANEIMFDCVSSRMDDIPTFEQYKACIQTIGDYANSIPKWVLKGHSANTLDTLKVNIKVEDMSSEDEEVQYEDPAMELPQTQLPPDLMKLYDYCLATPHVSAEDRCPCGSGRPYRLCHGRHTN